eukprot:gnl/TRDRNA2_/TRDRNA2_136277_c1_seq4.p1 gnl/TRDRNA2_/TRDRNA2_136277_c1~~gnl/TRDRNA2_/TRDRNA2_136277_c1_seq4.p1  ORF type:complete len:371 (+),score=24.24 gnl/TRDRNA2_/TRDRNA2_136277_c1_seq4:68-1180(+)
MSACTMMFFLHTFSFFARRASLSVYDWSRGHMTSKRIQNHTVVTELCHSSYSNTDGIFENIPSEREPEEIRHGSLRLDRHLRPDPGPLNDKMNSWPAIQKSLMDPKIVISLTTVPEMLSDKMMFLGKTLASLRQQTVRADSIELNLPNKSQRLGAYGGLQPNISEGINVYHTDDWLALTNIIPTVQRAQKNLSVQETLVIVVDDDKVYPPSLVEDHLRAFRERPSSASTCRGYKLPSHHHLSSGWDELRHSAFGHKLGSHVRVACVTGSDSWSAPVSLFTKGLWMDLADGHGPQEMALKLMNDVWVSGQLSKHNIPKYAIPCRQECWDTGVSKRFGVASNDTGGTRRLMNNVVVTYFAKAWSREESEESF